MWFADIHSSGNSPDWQLRLWSRPTNITLRKLIFVIVLRLDGITSGSWIRSGRLALHVRAKEFLVVKRTSICVPFDEGGRVGRLRSVNVTPWEVNVTLNLSMDTEGYSLKNECYCDYYSAHWMLFFGEWMIVLMLLIWALNTTLLEKKNITLNLMLDTEWYWKVNVARNTTLYSKCYFWKIDINRNVILSSECYRLVVLLILMTLIEERNRWGNC